MGQIDVLVLGEHPAAYLAAALLRHKSKLNIVQAAAPGESAPDRLVLVNPAFYNLHPLLSPWRRKIQMSSIYGLAFLAEKGVRSEYRSKSAVNFIAQCKDIRAACQKIAAKEGVQFIAPREIQIQRMDEQCITVSLGKAQIRPRALVLSSLLSPDQNRMLGLPDAWERGILHRYSFVRLRGVKLTDTSSRPLMPMSLDLRNMLLWAWLLPGPKSLQLAVHQPAESIGQASAFELLNFWGKLLHEHGVLRSAPEISPREVQSIDLPLAGALAHEGVANRTLLVGPAGGFYSGSGEDIYPNCWSALFAADVLKKALTEEHLQDAVQPYRQKWRTTLGGYLRGPQQNLRFLLPLVYRNPVMAHRVAEAILLGTSLVR